MRMRAALYLFCLLLLYVPVPVPVPVLVLVPLESNLHLNLHNKPTNQPIDHQFQPKRSRQSSCERSSTVAYGCFPGRRCRDLRWQSQLKAKSRWEPQWMKRRGRWRSRSSINTRPSSSSSSRRRSPKRKIKSSSRHCRLPRLHRRSPLCPPASIQNEMACRQQRRQQLRLKLIGIGSRSRSRSGIGIGS